MASSFNSTPRRQKRTAGVPAISWRAREFSDCVYCPNKIRPGMPVTRDFEAREVVHAGCYQRVNGAILRANKEKEVAA